MKLSKSFKIALNIIFHSQLRSWLTILGIVIGIAAIVSIVSVGQGAQIALQSNLNSLSADMITINPGFSRAVGAGAGFRFGGGSESLGSGQSTAKNLTSNDVILLKSVPNVVQVMGIISGTVSNVFFLGKTSRASVEGVDTSVWKNIDTTTLSSGRYLTQGDTNVIVVGFRVANSTFSGMEVNREVTISGKIFRVVGILSESGGSDDSRIFMSISDALNIIDGKKDKNYDSIIVKIGDISKTDDTIAQITNQLMLSHGILQSKNQDFTVNSPKAIQERVTSALSSASLFLTAIAVISLIVGAIGIMNTMFTSVLEKTNEIGILKALGAKNGDILAIFLMNSGIIGFIGGIFGIILGVLGSGFIAGLANGSSVGRFSLSSSYVSPTLAIGVFAISIAVGLIAGAIPAYRASKLNPVEALRYE